MYASRKASLLRVNDIFDEIKTSAPLTNYAKEMI